MENRIASPNLVNDPGPKLLHDILESIESDLKITDSIFYYNFPIFRDEANQLYRSKVLFTTKSNGLFVLSPIGTIERDLEKIKLVDKELIHIDSILYGKLLRNPSFRQSKRDIFVGITTVIYCLDKPDPQNIPATESQVISTPEELKSLVRESAQAPLSDLQWDDLASILEGTKAISRQDDRDISSTLPNSKSRALATLEEKIAIFDADQRQAALSIGAGPQRVRGIAGSGKTIVLALRAAHLHLSNPRAKILLTFWTKSLYDMLKHLITKFYRQFDDKDPDWNSIHLLHAWGGRSVRGVYYNACIENGIRPQSFTEIVASNNRTKFEQACFNLVQKRSLVQKYDFILIDEGQDIPPMFYHLCFRICKGGDKDRNIIWAYDELQTIMDTRPQDVTQTFGTDEKGVPLIDLDRASQELSQGYISHDIVLRKSYRNPPEILMCAHAIGMGLYSKQPVQILEDMQHWEDLGYEIVEGECVTGQHTIINRPTVNSPLDLASLIDKQDIIQYASFESFSEEVNWAVDQIISFLAEGLLPHDILVISLDDRNAKGYFSSIGELLADHDIPLNNLQNSSFSIPKFFVEGHVSVSTVYKAKGNEAAVVLVVGVEALATSLEDRRTRNMLFTAFTRSRAWLRISGLGIVANLLFEEIETANNKFPNFEFIYPDLAEIDTIQRDLSEKSIKLREMEQLMLDLGLTGEDLDILKSKVNYKKIIKE
jgi:superfamily I DNA and RNA helicase